MVIIRPILYKYTYYYRSPNQSPFKKKKPNSLSILSMEEQWIEWNENTTEHDVGFVTDVFQNK